MPDRRDFLFSMAGLGAAGLGAGSLGVGALENCAEALDALSRDERGPEDIAADDDFWVQIGRAFPVDRSLVNLNNGGVSPSTKFALEAQRQHIEFSNHAPSIAMWQILEPRKESVRDRLARHWGVLAEEIAITRNASESLMICQFGIDLARGDHVLTSDQDYPRMLDTFRQRVRREGIVLDLVKLPVPCEDDDEVVRRFEAKITKRTKLILVSHMVNLTGQILPAARVVALGRKHGIPVIVDGAHALAHFAFKISDLDCDYYASSLHKWLFAPIGTGLLYVRKDKIKGLWPLTAANESLDDDIRKFEQIGTHPIAGKLAIAEALTFHQGIGDERKAARLVHLRDTWAKRLAKNERVRLHTSLEKGLACGIATFSVDGVDHAKLRSHLWTKHRILTTAITHEDFTGIRVSPSVYTTKEELNRFCDVVETVIAKGLPT